MNYKKLTKTELVKILELRENPIGTESPSTVYEYLKPYSGKKQEYFLVVMLDGARQIMNVKVVSMGLVNRALVHPREVFAPAIENRATAIMLAHNHPSGDLCPSLEDLSITARLRKAGALLGIEVVDHIIFSEESYRSLLETGEF